MSKIYFHLDWTFCCALRRSVTPVVLTKLWWLHRISCLIAQGWPYGTNLARDLRSMHLLRNRSDMQLGKKRQIKSNVRFDSSQIWGNNEGIVLPNKISPQRHVLLCGWEKQQFVWVNSQSENYFIRIKDKNNDRTQMCDLWLSAYEPKLKD